MKIALLTQYYPPEIGAPQGRLSSLAKALVKRGHTVFVLTAMPNYPLGRTYEGYGGCFRREELAGVQVIRTMIYPTKSVARVKRLASYGSFVVSSAIAGAMALPKLDYLLTESPPLFLGLTGYLLSRLKSAKSIFNVSDLWPESAVRLGIIGDGPALRVAERLESFCYRKAWLVTGQSREILEDIQKRFPKTNAYHLSNGTDSSTWCSGTQAESTQNQTCMVIYAGLHGIAQGLDQVIAAAHKLKQDTDIKFVLVGDGPDKKKLMETSQQMGLTNVSFLDPRPAAEVRSLLLSADIGVVPLKGRIPGAVPSKLYEVMGAGLPVVLVADGEPATIVRENKAGIVVAPGDVEGLANALRQLAHDKTLRESLGRRGVEAVNKHFDRRKIHDSFVDYLENDTNEHLFSGGSAAQLHEGCSDRA
jgi:glycosyltransferase involved in cell wall biosynthesis